MSKVLHYKADFEFDGERHERVIESPVELSLGANLDNLLSGDFFRWSEESGDIENITLNIISEESYNEVRSNKSTIWLVLSGSDSYATREVL